MHMDITVNKTEKGIQRVLLRKTAQFNIDI